MSLAARILVALVRGYQRTLAHWLGGQCRMHPTCSEYAIEALRTHGALRGAGLALRRIARCHPWGPMGDDPVPARRGPATGGASPGEGPSTASPPVGDTPRPR